MGLAVAGRDAVKVSHILIKHSASRKATSRLDAEGKQIKERSVPDARAALIRVRRRLVADCASFRAGSQDGSGCESAVPGAGAGEERRATDGMALDHVEQLFAAAARNVSDCNRCLPCSPPVGILCTRRWLLVLVSLWHRHTQRNTLRRGTQQGRAAARTQRMCRLAYPAPRPQPFFDSPMLAACCLLPAHLRQRNYQGRRTRHPDCRQNVGPPHDQPFPFGASLASCSFAFSKLVTCVRASEQGCISAQAYLGMSEQVCVRRQREFEEAAFALQIGEVVPLLLPLPPATQPLMRVSASCVLLAAADSAALWPQLWSRE